MSATSFAISSLLGSAAFWEDVEYVGLTALFVAAIIASLAELTWVAEIEEMRLRWGKVAAWILILASAIELLATYKANSINDKEVADLRLQTAQAYQLAGQLGAKEGQLDVFVHDKTGKIDIAIADLNEAKKRAEAALGKIDSLTNEETTLKNALKNDESEQGKLEEALTPRHFDQYAPAMALKPFAKFPVFVVSDPHDEPTQFGSFLLFTLAWAGMDAHALPWDNGVGSKDVTVMYEIRASDLHPFDPRAETAATVICRELAKQNIPVRVGLQITPGGDGDWVKGVPAAAVLIRVGPEQNEFFMNKWLASKGLKPLPDTKAMQPPHVPRPPFETPEPRYLRCGS